MFIRVKRFEVWCMIGKTKNLVIERAKEPRNSLLEVFKVKSGLSAVAVDELFEVDNQQRTQGHS